MQCKQVQLLLNDYIDRDLSVLQTKGVVEHCATCQNCAKDLALLQQQQQALTSLPVSSLSEYTKKRLFRQATADDCAVHGYLPVKLSYRFAAVAMLAVVVLLLSFIYYPGNGNNVRSMHLITVDNGVHTVKVAIDSKENLDGVSFRVDLSDNLQLAGFGNKKQIQWMGGLHKGVNIISLPIIGIAQGNGEITTRIFLHGNEKIMRINTRYRQVDGMVYDNDNIRQS